jgi:hypothetical protein
VGRQPMDDAASDRGNGAVDYFRSPRRCRHHNLELSDHPPSLLYDHLRCIGERVPIPSLPCSTPHLALVLCSTPTDSFSLSLSLSLCVYWSLSLLRYTTVLSISYHWVCVFVCQPNSCVLLSYCLCCVRQTLFRLFSVFLPLQPNEQLQPRPTHGGLVVVLRFFCIACCVFGGFRLLPFTFPQPLILYQCHHPRSSQSTLVELSSS